MTNISNNGIITIHRGDTFQAPILINIGTKINPEFYALDDRDVVYISICEPNQLFEDGLIRRIVTQEQFDFERHAWLNLSSEDTSNVKAGVYYYEIRIKLVDDTVAVIVPRKKFIVLE